MTDAEKRKFEEFYEEPEEYEEEEEFCPEGFTEDEDCDAEHRSGIEHCEFLCPFRRLYRVRDHRDVFQ